MRIKTILIIGVGLIGGSIAKGLIKHSKELKIIGWGSDENKIKRALKSNVINCYEVNLSKAVLQADLIIFSVPLGAMENLLKEIKPYLKLHTIVTDVGSSKKTVVELAERILQDNFTNFIAGHPLAGKEHSGFEASESDLFLDHPVILTPVESTSCSALNKVEIMWKSLGACVSKMSPDFHDDLLAATSHLPHLLSFTLVELLSKHKNSENIFNYTSGGFKDFTRIASSDATMWRDIAIHNHEPIASWLKEYRNSLDELIYLVENKQSDKLFKLFSDAKKARELYLNKQI